MDKKRVKQYFSKENTVYTWWDPHKSDKRDIYIRQEKIISEIVKENKIKKIIDISSGKGRYAALLSRGRDYTCLDISKQMLEHIDKLNLGVRLIKADVEKVPLKEKFDLVLCSEALVHYPNPNKAIKEMKRILKKEGLIIITGDNKYCFEKIIRFLIRFLKDPFKAKIKIGGNDVYMPYSNKDYRRFFHKEGLIIEKTICLSILTTPIKIDNKNDYLLSPRTSRKFLFIDYILEKIPLINKLSTYFIYILRNG